MNWKTSIPEIIDLQNDFKLKRAKAKSAANKFKKKINYYYFLDVIIAPKKTQQRDEDDLLEIAIRDLFNSIGIKSKIPLRKDDFDVKATFKNIQFGIEVKNGNLPSENDMLQAHKYSIRVDKQLHPIVIWNNTTTNQEFDSNRIKDAQLNQYGIITTKELYKGYLKLKMNKITFEIFIGQLQKIGLIKFSSKILRASL